MAKERLHYQKTFIEKAKAWITESFVFQSSIFKKTCLLVILLLVLFFLFLTSTYRYKIAVGGESPQTVNALKEINIEKGGKQISFKRGQVIVSKGKVVTNEAYSAIQNQNELLRNFQLRQIFIKVFISLCLFLLFGFYLGYFHRTIVDSTRLSSVLVIIIVSILVIGIIAQPISRFFYVTPAAAIVSVLLFNPPVAIAASLVTVIISAFLSGSYVIVLTTGVIGSAIAIFTASKKKERLYLIQTAFFLSLALIYLNFMVSFFYNGDLKLNILHSFYGLASGLTSTVVALGVIPFLEGMFGLTTDFKLLELTQSNKDLLKKLMAKAPGTYSHSLNVATMVEAVAPDIQADPLIAKAGGLYHDIGKIRRPYFFTENQLDGQNPHEKTNAGLSCLIITAHVKDGVDIGKKNNLPEEVIDIIRQHHGSTVVSYFYNYAKRFNKQVNECDFRYNEEKPKSKEAALVMLADSVEAAARSFAKPSARRLEETVIRLIQQRIDDGQLEESSLSFADIEIIKRKFAEMLINIYHPRVKYSKTVIPLRKKIKNGSVN